LSELSKIQFVRLKFQELQWDSLERSLAGVFSFHFTGSILETVSVIAALIAGEAQTCKEIPCGALWEAGGDNPRLKTHFHSLGCSGEDAGNPE
jgi:hypothetical protein